MGRSEGMWPLYYSRRSLLTVVKYFGDQYTVSERKLGNGRFGDVFLAHEVETTKQVACKIVDLNLASQQLADSHSSVPSDTTWEAGLRLAREEKRKILREIGILAKLSHVGRFSILFEYPLMRDSLMWLISRKHSVPTMRCRYSHSNLHIHCTKGTKVHLYRTGHRWRLVFIHAVAWWLSR